MRRSGFWPFVVILAACGHSDSFTSPVNSVGPLGSGPDIRLTVNSDQDYWPSWTQDGRGILYAFVDRSASAHRCLGLLPAAGGTRLWQLCDNSFVRGDTASSYIAYSMDNAGRLLVAEAVASATGSGGLPVVSLWQADTARPFARTSLLTLPVTVGGVTVTWLANLQWTGPSTFLALGQQFFPAFGDSLFADNKSEIVRGSIVGGHATLEAVPGTAQATDYSLAMNGSEIVFTVKHDLRLFTIPFAGGAATPAPPDPAVVDTAAKMTGELAGLSCKGTTCIVAKDAIFIAGDYWVFDAIAGQWTISFLRGGLLAGSLMELHRISLADGSDAVVESGTTIYANPQISPTSGDVVVQLAGVWGHLQTHSITGVGDLHLLKGLVP